MCEKDVQGRSPLGDVGMRRHEGVWLLERRTDRLKNKECDEGKQWRWYTDKQNVCQRT